MFPIRDHNPSGRTPYVTYLLIAANIAIFLWALPLYDNARALSQFYYDWGFVPARFSAGENPAGLITSMFLHGGWMHLAGNMLFLFIFGDNIEDELGHLPFAAFYIASGIAAALAQYASGPMSPVPTVGASGAIAGLMGAYLLMFPKAKVDVLIIFVIFFRIFPIPAWIVLMVWFGMQLINSVGSSSLDGGVAYWAHAGGFLAGLIIMVPVWIKRGATQYWTRTEGHPPHPEAKYPMAKTSIPKVTRRK
ncbi:rhomboid family intramembrane serine protease [Pseudoprimorskyibacter insulae]|uniref:Rhomboid protease AarA n=1 Tax=Pseudoprimorskyibacter insulae TaxID=1695997 RepID=A0A2R8APU8_9RHOB|nr:rhomboid family intramembrane serine protease [Pseudoprimorskyibacter insulae]SPF78071.1 Rhomboid protease AarA [Pseudoprimorskyibacter insulae]